MNAYDESLQWIEAHAIPCPFHLITGCDCPGCGMQRSVYSLLRGNFSESLQHHPAGILFVLFVLTFMTHLQLRNRYSRKALDVLLIGVVAVSLIQYVIRWINGELCF